MRRVQNVRHLASGEIQIARTVFRNGIPYDTVLISDGLGKNDREFTMPTSIPLSPLFNVSSSEGKYVIHAGDGYYGMSYKPEDRRTLIHELTHVWQGEHETSAYWAFSLKDQATSDDAYAYDHEHLDSDWDNYGMEQQASIVEQWFADGSKEYDPETYQGDKRFFFIKTRLWGEKVDYNWLAPVVRRLPVATLKHDWTYETSIDLEARLLPLVSQRFFANDVLGYGLRIKRLEEAFGRLSQFEATVLFERLQKRSHSDKLANAFYHNLSHVTTARLLALLRTRFVSE